MVEVFVGALWQVIAWPASGFLLAGVAIGFVVGLLPGLGALSALALMLPFAHAIEEPVAVFCFLLGALAVTATTGDVTSVLFGIPGESGSAALVVDGYPMSRKGEAGRALGAAITSSVMGGWIGALALVLSVPVARPLMLWLGSPELFVVAIMGIALMGTVAGASRMKGLLSGGIGLMLAAVGVDPQTGSLRYTFGWTYLWDRLDVVPVVVGLLAVPEIVALAARGTSIAEAGPLRVSGAMAGVKDTFRHLGLVTRCSLIGVYFGVLPALGANVAQWISYGHAVHGLKDRTQAGRGAVEGILGPGAANNATRGGDLVPTVVFGIPGSASMALVLSAFLVGGLTPGPEMLGPRLDVTFAMVWALILANALGAAACFLVLRWLVALTFIRGSLLIPFLLLFVFVGAFTANHSLSDVVVALVFGVVGYAMLIGGWPRPPLILGLVLGRIAESYLWVSTAAYGGRWLLFPSVILLMLVTLLVVAYSLLGARGLRAGTKTTGWPDRAGRGP